MLSCASSCRARASVRNASLVITEAGSRLVLGGQFLIAAALQRVAPWGGSRAACGLAARARELRTRRARGASVLASSRSVESGKEVYQGQEHCQAGPGRGHGASCIRLETRAGHGAAPGCRHCGDGCEDHGATHGTGHSGRLARAGRHKRLGRPDGRAQRDLGSGRPPDLHLRGHANLGQERRQSLSIAGSDLQSLGTRG
mmetsp:Transcript_97363/g.302708  ORF Transcript_97363/g.302708 Transcript_97363/m.302708 type:complete len:200 (-) Transcript_97363:2288-2887(-)